MAKSAFKVKSGGKWKGAPKGSKAPTFSVMSGTASGFKARPGVGNGAPKKPVSFAPMPGNSSGFQGRASFGNKPMNPQPVQGPKKPTGAENKKRKQDSSFGEKAGRMYKAAGLNVNRETGRMAKSYKEGGAKGLGKYAMDNHKGKILTGAGLAVAGVGTAAYRKRQEDKKFKNRVKDRLGIRR